jgi:mannose-6-phosphate isomerase-like protein (cupin superfamily)
VTQFFEKPKEDEQNAQRIRDEYRVKYFSPGEKARYTAPDDHHYHFESYAGAWTDIEVPLGGCAFYINADKTEALRTRGPCTISSQHMCVVMPGFKPPNAMKSLRGLTVLPYVNGCSTKQIFPPDRPGDPTLQYLHIPANSAEQAHHIHSTVRVVYILGGRGISVVGMDEQSVTEELKPGMVCVLDPMCPHHFETPFGEKLICVPFHVFSTVPGSEANHPMFNGTFLMNQS